MTLQMIYTDQVVVSTEWVVRVEQMVVGIEQVGVRSKWVVTPEHYEEHKMGQRHLYDEPLPTIN